MHALVSLLSVALLAPPRPTSAALRKAYEQNRAAVVEVKGAKHRGTGVVVGAEGEVLTSTSFVDLESAHVTFEREPLPAKVLWADARVTLALVKLADTRPYPSAAVRLTGQIVPGEWLIGILRDRRGRTEPRLGRVLRAPGKRRPFIETDLPLAAGSPVFDAQGKLLGLSVGGARAVPVSHVKRAIAVQP